MAAPDDSGCLEQIFRIFTGAMMMVVIVAAVLVF